MCGNTHIRLLRRKVNNLNLLFVSAHKAYVFAHLIISSALNGKQSGSR